MVTQSEEEPVRESELYEKKWVIGYANAKKAKCKNGECLGDSEEIAKGELRIGRRYPSPFKDEEVAVNWFHAKCMFDQQRRSRKTTQVIERPEDMDGFYDLAPRDQQYVEQLLDDFRRGHVRLNSTAPKKNSKSSKPAPTSKSKSTASSSKSGPPTKEGKSTGIRSTVGRSSSAAPKEKEIKKKKKEEGGRRDVGRVIML